MAADENRPLTHPGVPVLYETVPEQVEVVAFDGTWGTFLEICGWVAGRAGCYFVPEGYEHGMRTDREYDRSTGHVLEGAEAFMVLAMQKGPLEGAPMRVNRGGLIARRCVDGEFFVLGRPQLGESYRLVGG